MIQHFIIRVSDGEQSLAPSFIFTTSLFIIFQYRFQAAVIAIRTSTMAPYLMIGQPFAISTASS